METTPAELITCDMCGKETYDNEDDTLIFGKWMRRIELTVHYFCLLMSTNLPQRGNDTSGIMGFLIRDIRKEIAAARKRICCYCGEPGATIKCNTCGKYFDLVCSVGNSCTMQFSGQFLSYCLLCQPMDEYRQQLVDHPPHGATCDICMNRIAFFQLNHVVFPECCRLGFVHKMCMRRYANTSGYYLTCIWCRSSEFRETIRMQGIFVPDRDAEWERQRDAFRELHRRTLRCDEAECLSRHGRSYNKGIWRIIACNVCGSTGAHARCLARSMQLRKGAEPTEFKCTFCQEVEKKLTERAERRLSKPTLESNTEDHVDNSFFVSKKGPQLPTSAGSPETEGPMFSDDDADSSSNPLVITVIANQRRSSSIESPPQSEVIDPRDSPPQAETIDLRDSPPQAETIDLMDSPPQAETIDLRDSPPQTAATDLRDSPPQTAATDLRDLPPQAEAIDLENSQSQPEKFLQLRESFNCPGEPFFYLVVYEFDEQGLCKGSCTLRFDDQDPRVKDRSEEALIRVQIRPEDVWFRNKDCGVYGIVHKYMDTGQLQ